MAYEADFCGDRLRLSAFLRVADGVPKRPTRFKRRTRPVEADEASRLKQSAPTDNSPVGGYIYGEFLADLSVFDISRSATPDEALLGAVRDSRSQRDRGRPDSIRIAPIPQAKKCAAANSPLKTRKTSSARRRQRLPVNELVLLRTTSSDGLPRPSDIDQVIAAPAADVDAIEDNQIVSCTPFSTLSGSRAFHRVQEPNTIRTSKHRSAKSSAFLLQGRPGNCHSSRRNGGRRNIPRVGFSTGSDGFVGTELTIQHNKGFIQSRAKNTWANEGASASGELMLASGYLPAPLVEQHVGVLQRSGQTIPNDDHMQIQVQVDSHETRPLSQRALTEIRRAMSDREARKRRQNDMQQHENMVRCQLSGITAPARGVSEDSSSECSNESHIQGSEEDDIMRNDIPSPHGVPLVHMPTSHEATRYFENQVYDLDATARSDSCDEEFWSQYPGMESSDGCWFPGGAATGSLQYM